MIQQTLDVQSEIERLKRKFAEEQLDLRQVYGDIPAASPELEHRGLSRLWDLVCAYRLCPNPKKLMRLGFDYPPMHPDIDPWTDWLRFGRWVNHEPLMWKYVDLHGPLLSAASLTDAQLSVELERIIDRLAEAGVVVDPLGNMPDRELYRFLETDLPTHEFLHLAPGTWCHIGPEGE